MKMTKMEEPKDSYYESLVEGNMPISKEHLIILLKAIWHDGAAAGLNHSIKRIEAMNEDILNDYTRRSADIKS